ncbi:hypothetical protein FM113_07605 [Leucobacter sp. 7(1)]|uniref:hypothetical protein n=1 Tax=Leucobacter sp. 7(1) TaxID=1255613 RepID=UPI00097F0CA4|nr:hypothetical protein [Leucobacter sp. 7(1)]SJN09910.1 hypothetical protein FM113_07605 [Leucobacter sp. 7(1)]
MGTSNLSMLEREFSFRELNEMSYGHRNTITQFVREGRVPGRKVRNGYKILGCDLHLLGEWSLGDYLKALANAFPKLDASQKIELNRLLSCFQPTEGTLGDYAKELVHMFPQLDASEQIELRWLLTRPSAT